MRLLLFLALLPLGARAEEGLASYVSPRLAGRPTASGEPFSPRQLTAASSVHYQKSVLVTNLANGRSVRVWVNDKGPAKRLHRAIDLSPAAYWWIARPEDIRAGTMRVRIE